MIREKNYIIQKKYWDAKGLSENTREKKKNQRKRKRKRGKQHSKVKAASIHRYV